MHKRAAHDGDKSIFCSLNTQRTCRPVVEHVLGDVCRRVVRGESEVLRFPADQDEAEMHLRQKQRQLGSQKRRGAQRRPSVTVPSALPLTSLDTR